MSLTARRAAEFGSSRVSSPLAGGWAAVFAGDREIGRVTSGGFSPSLQHPIAMAYVDAGSSAPGTALELDNRGKRLAARVVPLPFVPHRYHR